MRTRQEVFTKVFDQNLWLETETHSGGGSTLHATEELRTVFPQMLCDLGITSLLDAGCGDANWMPDLGEIDYHGIDIVPGLIEEVQVRRPHLRFTCADIVSDALPQADAVLCRDVLQHLPRDDVSAALQNIRRSGADWLLATTFRSGNNASRGELGGYQEWDLESAPFDLGQAESAFYYITWYRPQGELIPVSEAYLGAWRMVG